jgi:hypothetical protein
MHAMSAAELEQRGGRSWQLAATKQKDEGRSESGGRRLGQVDELLLRRVGANARNRARRSVSSFRRWSR